jgi:gamma-glutamyl:cysteine ligase YbdK (ATP-grasp superfamily)
MEKEINHPHKSMYESPKFSFENGEYPMNGEDLKTGGAILLIDGNPSHFVRGPLWRSEKGDPIVRIADVRPIYLTKRDPDYAEINSGSELELFAWDPEAQISYPIMGVDSPIVNDLLTYNNTNGNGFKYQADHSIESPDQLNFSSEFLQQMLEIKFRHFPDAAKRAKHTLGALRVVTRIAEENGIFMTPVANLPDKEAHPEEVNPDPYVRRIVFDYMKWKRAQNFTGCSFQTHVELFDSQAGLKSINYLQQVSPLLLSLSTAGPFSQGRINLNEQHVQGVGNNYTQLHSTRYFGRKYGSPSGGVIQFPAPNNLDDFFQIANERLATQDINTVARTLGHHTSFRWRGDIKPYGTLEFADQDTLGAHPVIMSANQEFIKALTVKVQAAIAQGKESELPKELFGELSTERLTQVESDMIAVSIYGLDANIHSPDGEMINIQEQNRKLLDWVATPDDNTNYYGLTHGVYDQMQRSTEKVSEATFQNWDPSSPDFLYGYYDSRLGTLSQWLHRKAHHLTEFESVSEQASVANSITELGYVFHAYLKNPDIDQELMEVFS